MVNGKAVDVPTDDDTSESAWAFSFALWRRESAMGWGTNVLGVILYLDRAGKGSCACERP